VLESGDRSGLEQGQSHEHQAEGTQEGREEPHRGCQAEQASARAADVGPPLGEGQCPDREEDS